MMGQYMFPAVRQVLTIVAGIYAYLDVVTEQAQNLELGQGVILEYLSRGSQEIKGALPAR